MAAGPLIVLFALGAGAIALWIDVRFPRLAPHDMRGALIQVGIWMVSCYLIAGPAMDFLFAFEEPRYTLLAIFGFAFPVIVYGLLSGLWVMKVLNGFMRGLPR